MAAPLYPILTLKWSSNWYRKQMKAVEAKWKAPPFHKGLLCSPSLANTNHELPFIFHHISCDAPRERANSILKQLSYVQKDIDIRTSAQRKSKFSFTESLAGSLILKVLWVDAILTLNFNHFLHRMDETVKFEKCEVEVNLEQTRTTIQPMPCREIPSAQARQDSQCASHVLMDRAVTSES